MRKFLSCFVITSTLLIPSILVAEPKYTAEQKKHRFELFVECKPMDIVVEYLNKGASKIGLTRKSLQYTIESRLRMARLYNPEASHYLYININVHGGAFSLELAFKKLVRDPISRVTAFAVTWVVHSLGSYGNIGAPFVLSTLSKYMDEFLAEFLRVNEKACNS